MSGLVNPRPRALVTIEVTELMALKAFLATEEGNLFLEHYRSNPREKITNNIDITYRNSSDSFLVKAKMRRKPDSVNNLVLWDVFYAVVEREKAGLLKRTLTTQVQLEANTGFRKRGEPIIDFGKEDTEDKVDTVSIDSLEASHVGKRLDLYRSLINRSTQSSGSKRNSLF